MIYEEAINKKSVSIMEDARKPVEIAHDGKNWKSIKIGIDIDKCVPDINIKRKGLQDFINDDPSLLNKVEIDDIPKGDQLTWLKN